MGAADPARPRDDGGIMKRMFTRTVAVFAISTAALFSGGTSIAAVQAEIDLGSAEGRAAYLVERGIEPSEAIIQVGSHLYAGSDCPGGAFSCIDPKGAPVLQVGVPDARGTSMMVAGPCSGPNCQFIQTGPGDKVASCDQATAKANRHNALQVFECRIEQGLDGSTGNNTATATQSVDQRASGGSFDLVNKTFVNIDQSAAAGYANTATVDQVVSQTGSSSGVFGSVTQVMDTYNYAEVSQDSIDGDNTAQVHQTQQGVKVEADNGLALSATQLSNTRPETNKIGPRDGRCGNPSGNLTACVMQFSDTGKNNLRDGADEGLTQEMQVRQSALSLLSDSTQKIGTPAGGLVAVIDGDSNYVPPAGETIDSNSGSMFNVSQFKDLRQKGGSEQDIDDLEICCLPGFSQTYDFCKVDQDAHLSQTAPGATSTIDQGAIAAAREGCRATQKVAGQTVNQQESTFVNLTNDCAGTSCTSQEGPQAFDDEYTATQGQTLEVDAADGVLANDTDPENDPLTAVLESDVTGGALTLNADGSFDYTPDEGTTTDEFTYRAHDGTVASLLARVTITVNQVQIPQNGVFVLDVSGSMEFDSGHDCNGDGQANAADDLNGDGQVGNSLDCAVAKIIDLNSQFQTGGTDNVGMVVFGTEARTADMSIAAGQQDLAAPDADSDGNSVFDLEDVARSVDTGHVGLFTPHTFGGGTDHTAALDHLNAMLAGFAGDTNIAHFMGDGQSSQPSQQSLDDAANAGTVIHTYAFRLASGCDAGQPLRVIADATGGTCTVV